MDLFDATPDEDEAVTGASGAGGGAKRPAKARTEARPLAERMRPRTFEEWVGQARAAGPASPLRSMLEQDRLVSMIFWGPPGCGKTTLARLVASRTGMAFQPLSAVTSGVKDVKTVIEHARYLLQVKQRRTLLFIDEIHRFNKAQQDAFLPHVEDGTITLIGATTENPSFSVNAPLLSRCRVITLGALAPEDLVEVLRRALADKANGLGTRGIAADEAVLEQIAGLAEGDARRALNLLEQCATLAEGEPRDEGAPPALDTELIRRALDRDHLFYDKGGEEHFNLISAFHKSMRASDPNGAVYWLFRMLESGEDPLWIARRILACASEDVGNADPQALQVAVAALASFQSMGLPEGELPLAQAAIYVATAPKSNAVNVARMEAKAAVRQEGSLPVPMHLRNAPTGLMKSIGYGQEYVFDHDAPEHFSGQPTLPDKLEGTRFYRPGSFGFEKEIAKRMEWWDVKRKERNTKKRENESGD